MDLTSIMGVHDEYGKRIVRTAAGESYRDSGPSVCVQYPPGQAARVDGTVGADIAIEIESRVFKQIRGAVLDLLCHPYPKKLLLILPAHMSDAEVTAAQCREIMALPRFAVGDFRVLVLRGTGHAHAQDEDVRLVREALQALGHGIRAGR